jgi:hypothetical protein
VMLFVEKHAHSHLSVLGATYPAEDEVWGCGMLAEYLGARKLYPRRISC